MEVLQVLLNQPDEFDRAVHGDDRVPALPEGGDLALITKDQATVNGAAGAVLTFTVELDGKLRRAQTVVTVKNLMLALRILEARYEGTGHVREAFREPR